MFLRCSDGLTGMVPEENILEIVLEHIEDLEKACDKLIDKANERGGYDNITTVIVKIL